MGNSVGYSSGSQRKIIIITEFLIGDIVAEDDEIIILLDMEIILQLQV